MSYVFILAKQSLFDSEMFGKADKTHEWLQYIDDKAKERLAVNDYNALMKHIKHVSEVFALPNHELFSDIYPLCI